jgi:hypothetical protein
VTPGLLTSYVEVPGLFQEQVQVGEVVRDEETRVPHEVQDVAEHAAVAVDEVVLLQGVQHDGDAAVEQLGQTRLRVPGTRFNNTRIQFVRISETRHRRYTTSRSKCSFSSPVHEYVKLFDASSLVSEK